MPRTFEIKTGTSDKKSSLERSKDPHAKLARHRAEHGLKVPLTPEQLGEDDNQAKRAWRINEHEAYVEVANDRGQRNSPNCAISLGHGPDGYGLRGGVIDPKEKLELLTEYLQPSEKIAFTSAGRLIRDGMKPEELPAKEHEALKLYASIQNLQRSGILHSNDAVYAHLNTKREQPSYKQAYHLGLQEVPVMTYTAILNYPGEPEDLDKVRTPALKEREEQGCSSNDAEMLVPAMKSLKYRYSRKDWWKELK